MNQEQDVLLEPDNPRLMPDSGRPPRAATPDTCKPAPPRPVAKSRAYLPVRLKFTIALLAGLAWAAVSIRLSLPWLDDLALLVGRPAAIFIIAFIA
jgi:biofilm PGA synthesis N-glycosyltransferase PgaC